TGALPLISRHERTEPDPSGDRARHQPHPAGAMGIGRADPGSTAAGSAQTARRIAADGAGARQSGPPRGGRDALSPLAGAAAAATQRAVQSRAPACQQRPRRGGNRDLADRGAHGSEQCYAVLVLGQVQQGIGDLAFAEKNLRAALKLAPDSVAALLSLGALLNDDNRPAEGEAVLRHALELPSPPAMRAALEHNLG